MYKQVYKNVISQQEEIIKKKNKLTILILIFLKTTPQIPKLYKQVYKRIISQQEEIIQRTKQMSKGAYHIHTDYVTGDTKERPKEIQEFFKRSKAQLNMRGRTCKQQI